LGQLSVKRASTTPGRSVPAASDFLCPLHRACLDEEQRPRTSIEALNTLVAEYQSCTEPDVRTEHARRLFLRCIPLVRKSLVRFCPFSQCYPGGCLPEELVGHTYVLFVQALDDYRPDNGHDFLGYAAQRLRWGLRHEARRLRKAPPAPPPDSDATVSMPREDEETRILDRISTENLLRGMSADNAALLRLRCEDGYSHRELATMTGLSPTAIRKRIQRLRDGLRAGVVAGADVR
jgi:RNA polymerase sigma factor (sigma-70 family)